MKWVRAIYFSEPHTLWYRYFNFDRAVQLPATPGQNDLLLRFGSRKILKIPYDDLKSRHVLSTSFLNIGGRPILWNRWIYFHGIFLAFSSPLSYSFLLLPSLSKFPFLPFSSNDLSFLFVSFSPSFFQINADEKICLVIFIYSRGNVLHYTTSFLSLVIIWYFSWFMSQVDIKY